jgi:hypothetical protein
MQRPLLQENALDPHVTEAEITKLERWTLEVHKFQRCSSCPITGDVSKATMGITNATVGCKVTVEIM